MPFQPFDLGQVMATAENIKSSRLQQQYLGDRNTREKTEFDQKTQAKHTKMLVAGAQSIVNAPPGQAVQQAYNIAKQLSEAGIMTFDEAAKGNWTEEGVRGYTQQILDQYEPFVKQEDPGQLESVIGPDGNPILLPRANAAGMQPAPDAPAAPKIPTSYLEHQFAQQDPAYAASLAQQNAGELSDAQQIQMTHNLALQRDAATREATTAAKTAETTTAAAKRVGPLITSADNTISLLKELVGDEKTPSQINRRTAGFFGSLASGIKGSQQYDIAADLKTIKSAISIDKLTQMREASKTGGALGNVAVKELDILETSLASLDQAQSPEQLRANLGKVLTHYQNWRDTMVQIQQAGGEAQTAAIPGANPTADTGGWSIEPL